MRASANLLFLVSVLIFTAALRECTRDDGDELSAAALVKSTTAAPRGRERPERSVEGMVLLVQVQMASLPIGRQRRGRQQPRVQARVANRKYDTDPEFLADTARFRIPLRPRDGSLMLDLFDGRKRKLGTVKKLLRKDTLEAWKLGWYRFEENLKGGNGKLIFEVFVATGSKQAVHSFNGTHGPDAVVHPEAQQQGQQTLLDVCLALYATASDGTDSTWCRDDDYSFGIYFACYGGHVDLMEVCFFNEERIEVQMCRQSQRSVSLRNTHIEIDGSFDVSLGNTVLIGATSSVKGVLVDGDFDSDTLVFADGATTWTYTRCELESAEP